MEQPEEGILAFRYPMNDVEAQNRAQVAIRGSQMGCVENEGRIGDILEPGLHTLNTRDLPVLTDLMNRDKEFGPPFKSDVYFFSTRLQIDRHWGTATITIREGEFGAARLRAYEICSYRVARAQAAVEYGLRSAQTVLSGGSSGEPLHLGVCRVNAEFFSCAWQFYPDLTLVVVLICALALAGLAFRRQRVR